jgi:hypothetical protein
MPQPLLDRMQPSLDRMLALARTRTTQTVQAAAAAAPADRAMHAAAAAWTPREGSPR